MKLELELRHGLSYGSVAVIPRSELEQVRLSVPGWTWLRQACGIVRHAMSGPNGEPALLSPTASWDPLHGNWEKGHAGIRRYKLPPEEHLAAAIRIEGHEDVPGLDLLDGAGMLRQRTILVGNRNLGNNFGFVAWDRTRAPRFFSLMGEAVDARRYSCLVVWRSGDLTVETLRFLRDKEDRRPVRAEGDESLEDRIAWCSYGQQVLRHGEIVPAEELLSEFYDLRHLLFHNVADPADQQALREAAARFADPKALRSTVESAWRAGRPRSRYLHNALGIGEDRIVILQRHGTPEEIGEGLKRAGARDGLLLDNGGSVFTWAWFAGIGDGHGGKPGGIVFSAPDFRPPSISVLAFLLRGAARHDEPRGTVTPFVS